MGVVVSVGYARSLAWRDDDLRDRLSSFIFDKPPSYNDIPKDHSSQIGHWKVIMP